jgi:hypothetical protein
VKVITPGRPQKGWAKECICTGAGNDGGGCGARVLVEQGDLFQTGKHSYDGSSEYFVTYECGACGVLNDIKDSPFSGQALPTRSAWEEQRCDREEGRLRG